MERLIKKLCLTVIILCFGLMSAVVYGFYSLPDEFYSLCDQEFDTGFYTNSFGGVKASKVTTQEGNYNIDLSLFNTIPVKSSKLKVTSRRYVVPSGEIVGLRLFTKGVMIVGLDTVETEHGRVDPIKSSGLKKGDVIVSLDGTLVENSAHVDRVISASEGKQIKVEYLRNGVRFHTLITPVYSQTESRYKTGLWIRDSAAGIGTMTFYEKNTGFFACLGHAVCDIDTGEELPLSDGDAVSAKITGCVKGKSGRAGELCGSFVNESKGILCMNSSSGVFGFLKNTDKSAEELPVAAANEIFEGPAKIISTVDGTSKEYFDVNIEKLDCDSKNGKNMVIKIVDKDLIEKTGGIVQGMSGSPVIQNGRLIGAVTHVFLNEPTRGYGIFAENMFETAFTEIDFVA